MYTLKTFLKTVYLCCWLTFALLPYQYLLPKSCIFVYSLIYFILQLLYNILKFLYKLFQNHLSKQSNLQKNSAKTKTNNLTSVIATAQIKILLQCGCFCNQITRSFKHTYNDFKFTSGEKTS